MENCLRIIACFVLSALLLVGASPSHASDPKLSTKIGIDSTIFSISIDAKEKPTAGKTFQATIHIIPGSVWHVWSMTMSGDGGLTPLRIKMPEAISKYYEITALKEIGKIVNGYDSNFETATKAYFAPYDIVATIKVKDNSATPVPFSLYVFFQTCNESMCMPPRTFEVPMIIAGQKSIDLTIAHGTPDPTPQAGEPKIETQDKSSLMPNATDDFGNQTISRHYEEPWRSVG